MFDHPNIVKLVDYFATPDTLCIVQEYCSARDLAWEVKEMRKTKKFFHEDCIWSWFVIILYVHYYTLYYYMYSIILLYVHYYRFLQLCCSIKHIHDRKILHRDIKTANIFLHRLDNNSWPIVKLGDFGIGKVSSPPAFAPLFTRICTSLMTHARTAGPRPHGCARQVDRRHAVLHVSRSHRKSSYIPG